ncbi:LytTR family DNA-binding domain-containing protein [Ichthyenterobacterium sp. W332]|uniref:LytTR family DNA-binding domain-containing protein n=1 Tax=Microcosmobacter mediterraneus TaxID=3075607 RepID=A0ABU2YPM1_9FLAO|nr:LytTR family DNA-binding domain-containing protein [Ichthyenterobacterium sp. W332]MDT0559649.1 LytTR family DNA-binding domain-containing protein [Ichthyenterobacterium sp. W332]
MSFLKKFAILKDFRLLIIATLIFVITFETLQQLFYINRYNLADNVTFFELLKTQAFRWFIWLILAFVLIAYHLKNISKTKELKDYLRLIGIIIGLVIANILIISLAQIIINNDTFSLGNLWNEYIPFYMYQKAPIYTLGYATISIILYLKLMNEKLLFDVQKLSELKEINTKMYTQLQNKLDDRASILNIKVGNKRKIIPVASIAWIESDDYCVKVHTTEGKSFSMRTSLKALNEKLDSTFMRVHRKAIVNMPLVKELNLSNPPSLILKNSVEIPISKNHIKLVRRFLS